MTPISNTNISEIMESHGLRPSQQRIAVLRYLMEHPVHPTADEIHKCLLPEMPTLSLTTVYNTLKLLTSHNVVDILLMDPHNAHFDYSHRPHAHLWCKQCGKIFDTELTAGTISASAQVAEGFKIEEVEICYKGVCQSCYSTDQ